MSLTINESFFSSFLSYIESIWTELADKGYRDVVFSDVAELQLLREGELTLPIYLVCVNDRVDDEEGLAWATQILSISIYYIIPSESEEYPPDFLENKCLLLYDAFQGKTEEYWHVLECTYNCDRHNSLNILWQEANQPLISGEVKMEVRYGYILSGGQT